MKTKSFRYTYTILRLLANRETDEFVNVGIVFHSPNFHSHDSYAEHGFLKIEISEKAVERARTFFRLSPNHVWGITENLKSIKHALGCRVIAVDSKHWKGEIPKNAHDWGGLALAFHPMGFQQSKLMHGTAKSPDQELARLFEEYVEKFA